MGIGTLLSGGVVKCDNCGTVVKDNRGRDAINKSGFGLLRDIGNATTKHFCSDKCKREWNAAHGKG